MCNAVPEKDLPASLDRHQAVEAAYSFELADAAHKLARGLPVLIECDKELTQFLVKKLKGRPSTRSWSARTSAARNRSPPPREPSPPASWAR